MKMQQCLKLKLKRSLLLIGLTFFSLTSFAQSRVVSGSVVDADDGEGIPGVNIIEKGTTNGVVTDLDGKYTITLKNSPATISFSMIGMVTQEKTVEGGNVIDIVLKSDVFELEQVVVTGYTSQKKADLTGAVSVIKVSDMMTEAENNPIKALQGRVAGMTVTADGNPSGAATVRIRGIGTMNNNDPLYVIDGVPTKGGMHELNSNDIESIQVLRDASAASIYGSRAANGVIIITTKRGKQGKVKLTFDAYLTNTFYNDRLKVMNSQEYGQALWQAAVNPGGGGQPNNNNIGYRYDWGYDDKGNPVLNNMYLPQYLDAGNTMRAADTDWFNEVSKKGLLQSYNMSVSNGTQNGNYFFSLGYFDNEGTIEYSSFNRISARMNSDYKIFDKLTIGENFTVNRTSEVQAPGDVLDLSLKALPMVPVHTVDGTGWGGPTKGMNDRQNPVRLLYDNKDNAYEYWRLFGNVYANLEIIKDLNIRTSFGLDYGNFYKRYMQHSYQSGFLNSDVSAVNLEQSHWMKWTWTNTITYNKVIGKNVFDLLGGIEMFRSNDIAFASYTGGENAFAVETPEYMWPNMSTGTAQSSGNGTGYSLLSYFGKINYTYDNRYLVSGTIRYDGSSRFGKNNRFGTFPAFSLGWRISEEAFMESTKSYLSDLKLRFGWGQTGNQEIENYAIYTIYVPDYGTADPTWNIVNGTAYDIAGNQKGELPSGFKKVQSGNDNLKWETTTQTNIGLDFGFFEQKLYGSAEYYIKSTKDILIKPAYLAVVGEGGDRWANGASMENKGYEITLGYRDRTSFGLAYDITGNISGFKNKVTYLPEEVENSYGGRAGDNILGRPYGSFYGYVADGLFRTQEEVDNHVKQDGKSLGRIRYANLDDNNEITAMDQTWIGVPYPDFSYGLNIYLEYKGIDLTVFFQGIQGIDINNFVKKQTDFWSVDDVNSNKGKRLLNAWSLSNPNSTIPAIQNTNTNDEGRFSTYYIEDGSYMKLRNLQLGYTLPKQISEKARMERLRLYVSGQNLFTVKSKNFTGVDPENPGFGYPIPITCTIGLNVTF
ncbi:MAG: TonB-dependent receptor [Tannerella sp.]|jgi:TonB-linked SusC/RagA family outer membrane protein|nr:TonB-dependent receptor [Tannerella sp.]